MFSDKISQLNDRIDAQPTTSRIALSPGVLAALERVHIALRKASSILRQYPGSSSLQKLAEKLAQDGLLVTLRSGLGVGIESPDYLATLRHSFLICQSGSSGLCVIVDPFFREQFKVAGMPSNSAYSTAVENLPECFVGTIGTVNALVCLLTGTLVQESAALGIELPPWRSKQALLSKWLPRRFADSVFVPPSFVSLHPALRSSVHGAAAATTSTLSTSPTSIQSWPSLAHTQSDVASSNGSTSACGSATTSASSGSDERSSSRSSLSQPHAVVTGFQCGSTACVSAAAAPRACPARSALTAQLASASNLSRTVQAEAEAHWQHCLMNLSRGPIHTDTTTAAAAAAPQRQASAAAAAAAVPAVATTTATTGTCVSGGGSGSSSSSSSLNAPRLAAGSLNNDVLRSLVVSPVHRRTGGGPASLKRGAGCSLKLSAATLKMLPRVYTVKLATAGCC